jgi:Na+/phosphate symporter
MKMFPDKKLQLTRFIHNLTEEVPEAAVTGIKKEVVHLIYDTFRFNLSILGIDQQLVFTQKEDKPKKGTIEEHYENLKLLQAEIFTFSSRVQSGEIEEVDTKNLNRYLHAARMGMHSAKSMKDVKHNFEEFESDDNEYIYNQNLDFRKRLIQLYLRVVVLFEEDAHEDIAGEMAKLLKHINKEDRELVASVQKVATKKSITDIQVSEMLMVNRVFIQSSRQVLAAIREVLLTEHEIAIFDSITDSELMR